MLILVHDLISCFYCCVVYEYYRATASGFSQLSDRITHLEKALKHSSMEGRGQSDEQQPENEKVGLLSGTAPGRLQGKNRNSNTANAQSNKKKSSTAGATKDKFGNVGTIAQAKAMARAGKKQQQHPPYAAFDDSNSNVNGGSSASNFHFQPKMRLKVPSGNAQNMQQQQQYDNSNNNSGNNYNLSTPYQVCE